MIDKSFNDVYNKHRDRIYYYLHTLQIPFQLRDEFYAEGMYAMWLAYEQYDETKGPLSTFLNYKIRFAMIDLIRKKEREREKTEQIIDQQITTIHTGNRKRHHDQLLLPDEQIQVKDKSLWVDLRRKLTNKQWKWVYYYIILDWPINKIANKEKVTVETVKGWAKMTRQKLRKDITFKKRLLGAVLK